MKLSKSFDRILILLTAFLIAFTLGAKISTSVKRTYAANESGIFVDTAEHFVTFYDEGQKLTVRTDAPTVGEALSRAGLTLGQGDSVDPGLDAVINSDNFYINIHRARPVLVRVGGVEKYIMTASYDAKTVANAAGFTVYDGDEIKLVPNDHFLETGVANVYEITRNGGRKVTVESTVQFTEREVKDYNLAPGTREVRQLGELGIKVETYEVMYVDGEEVSRELISEEVTREPVERIVAVGVSQIEKTPLTASRGVNLYTVTVEGKTIERKETYYDLPMGLVMRSCGKSSYTVREDGAKIDDEGYVLVAANLSRYPRCSVVETSLGAGKVYDTGGFAVHNPEQFDLATDWSNRDGK